MTDEILTYLYFFIGGALFLLVLLGLIVSASMPGINKNSKAFFASSFSVLILSIIAYVIDLVIYSNPNMAVIGRIIAFFETFLPSLLMPILTYYLLYCSGESHRKSIPFWIVIALCASILILLVVTQFSDFIYSFTSDNEFIRGPWYPILILPMIALIGTNLVCIIQRRKKLKKMYFVAFLAYLLPLLTVMIVQLFITVFLLIVMAVTVSALSMFGIIMADQIDEYLRQQKEIADQKASIAVLQMRPHFIYNTMTSIYYLCEQDPKKAQQITLDFTTYLRKNFNAIVGKEPIPFSEELAHTSAYLAVEKAQFEDRLIVIYDTPHILFRIPPLTLQPVVENAVKYGMNPDANEPLQITIKTEKIDTGSIITVLDNGPGISDTDNGEPHVAILNIQERLSNIGGTITYSSCETGGTSVLIFIPKSQNI